MMDADRLPWGRKTMKSLFCSLLLALLPTPASAMSGREYLDHCERAGVYDRAHCMGYLDAILRRDGETDFRSETRRDDSLFELAQTARPAPYCLPVGIQLSLLRDVVVRMLGQLPARRLSGDAGPLIRGILARTYPPHADCEN